jgi:copper(I)-binding protein
VITLHPACRWLAACLLATGLAGAAQAGDELRVNDAWLREAPPVTSVHAAYLTLENSGSGPVVIDRVSSPDFARVEIHRSEVADGMARMIAVERLEIPAGGSLALEPGGYHLMLFDARRPLRAGESTTLLLHRDNGSEIRVTVPVRRGADTEHQDHAGDGHHHH